MAACSSADGVGPVSGCLGLSVSVLGGNPGIPRGFINPLLAAGSGRLFGSACVPKSGCHIPSPLVVVPASSASGLAIWKPCTLLSTLGGLSADSFFGRVGVGALLRFSFGSSSLCSGLRGSSSLLSDLFCSRADVHTEKASGLEPDSLLRDLSFLLVSVALRELAACLFQSFEGLLVGALGVLCL